MATVDKGPVNPEGVVNQRVREFWPVANGHRGEKSVLGAVALGTSRTRESAGPSGRPRGGVASPLRVWDLRRRTRRRREVSLSASGVNLWAAKVRGQTKGSPDVSVY